MPDTKSSESESEKKGGGAKKMGIAAAFAVALLGGGYFVGGMMSGSAEPATAEAAAAVEAAEAEAAAEEEKEIGKLVDLAPINVNLQDGHFLRIAVALEIKHDEHAEGADDGHGKKRGDRRGLPDRSRPGPRPVDVLRP